MPIGLTIVLGSVGVCTGLAVAPISRPRRLAMLSYLLGMVVNEIPQVAAGFLVASVALAVARGDLNGPATVVVAALGLLILAGLAVIAARDFRARAVVAAAMREGLPDLAADPAVRRRWSRTLRILLTPLPVRPRRIVRIANIGYGEDRKQRLDVYFRTMPYGGRPVLVYFHGGGYVSGGKRREARALLHRFADRGWICISANYRLLPAYGFPDHLIDAKHVIAWAHANADWYGGNTRTLAVTGSSAGAHLAVLSALTPNHPVFQPDFEYADTSVTAAVGLYGYYGRYYGRDESESPPSTPLAYDAADAPPIWLAHGDHDTDVDVESARSLARHLRAGSAQPVVYAELPGAQHAFDLCRSVRFEAVLDGVETFLDRALATADEVVGAGVDLSGW
jgi:acetyl esterase/lipase